MGQEEQRYFVSMLDFYSLILWHHLILYQGKKSPGLILVYIYVECVDLKLCVAELQISTNPAIPPELEFIVSWVSCVMLFMMSY